MCRNIRPLFNFEPPTTDEDVRAAAVQFVRKISGFAKPSAANEGAFERAVDDISTATMTLVTSLVTSAAPRDREAMSERAKRRSATRFSKANRATS